VAVEYATPEWVAWFNNRRLLQLIGNIPPAESEQRFYAMLAYRCVDDPWHEPFGRTDWDALVVSA
jgi:hypothetical protein